MRDRNLRRYSVPFRGTIWGHNYSDETDKDIRVGAWTPQGGASDITPLTGFVSNPNTSAEFVTAPVPVQIVPVRVLQPHFGELSQLYIDLDMAVATTQTGLTLKIAVGSMADAPTFTPVTSYTQAYIDAQHRKVRGSDTPYSVSAGRIKIDRLSILPLIKKSIDSGFVEDAFVLLLCFSAVPSTASGYRFQKLNIYGAMVDA